MTTDRRGVSGLHLQRQLGVSYKTAWLLLHKLRRAMVVPDREKLRGIVEMDETWVGGLQTGLRGSRQFKGRKAALVMVAVERRGTALGRVRMQFGEPGGIADVGLAPGEDLDVAGVDQQQLEARLFEHVPDRPPVVPPWPP
jgi:hypothetical protein